MGVSLSRASWSPSLQARRSVLTSSIPVRELYPVRMIPFFGRLRLPEVEGNMKSILTSIAAAGLLATMAAAQPYHGRGLPLRLEGRASNGPASPGNRLLVYVITVGFEFGAIDLGSGAFLPIGPGLPGNVGDGLIPGPR